MGQFRGDYLGFTYNGFHSSDLGIVRVSDGSRYSENLLPSFQDKTATVPGKDETYYFGSNYTQQQINISFAFDDLTEERLNFLARLLGNRQIHSLIFDERPYKEYQAKITGSTLIKHVCFSEGASNRVYKGEGTISFVCYQPYAVCTKKFLNQYSQSNKTEWQGASSLLENQGELDRIIEGKIKVYNPGVKESNCVLTFDATEGNNFCGAQLSLGDCSLTFSGAPAKKKVIGINQYIDTRLTFDSKTKLIEGWYEEEKDGQKLYKKSGNIYNEYIANGDFFNIPITIDFDINGSVEKKTQEIVIEHLEGELESLADYFHSIDYNYYYY